MTPAISINLACEDAIHEAVMRVMIRDGTSDRIEVGDCHRRGGFGYLKTSAAKFNAAARLSPWFLLTDLDTAECPASLIANWLPGPTQSALTLPSRCP